MKLIIVCLTFILVLSVPLFAKIDPKTVVGLWLFDDGGGKVAKDSSENKRNGEVIGDVKWVDGKFGKAIELDGTGGHVKIPDFVNPTAAITITVWAKSPDPGWNQHGWLVEKRDAFIVHPIQATKNIAFCVVNGGPWNQPKSWDTGQIGPADITVWHMYTCTFDSKTGAWKIWIDGEEKSSMEINKAAIAADNGPMFIGNDTCCAGRFGKGIVDEVAIFSVALGKDDIQGIMKTGLTPAVLTAVKSMGKVSTTWAVSKDKIINLSISS